MLASRLHGKLWVTSIALRRIKSNTVTNNLTIAYLILFLKVKLSKSTTEMLQQKLKSFSHLTKLAIITSTIQIVWNLRKKKILKYLNPQFKTRLWVYLTSESCKIEKSKVLMIISLIKKIKFYLRYMRNQVKGQVSILELIRNFQN